MVCPRACPTTVCRSLSPTSPPATVTQFTNALEPDARSRAVFTFHRPEELIRLVKLDDQVRTLLREISAPQHGESVASANRKHPESRKLAGRKPPSLVDPDGDRHRVRLSPPSISVTGSSSSPKPKRILFLVDRNNLGKQTLNEFQQFVAHSTATSSPKNTPSSILKKNTIDPGHQSLHHDNPTPLLHA